jgi:putative molybdopterin biosynthesis protein
LPNSFNGYILTPVDDNFLYQKIANSIRQQILTGSIKPGERIPSVREMAEIWDCTIGTVQRAYQELVAQNLVISRPGQGTRVANHLSAVQGRELALRRAFLVHRAEEYLLEMLTAGYNLTDVEDALRQAMDRWRAVSAEKTASQAHTLRFAGSHDLVITWLASHFTEIAGSDHNLILNFTGSLGGLIALAEGSADIAGCHLWDEETDTFNLPFVHRVLPGKRVAMITLAQRRLGLMVSSGNPENIHSLADLVNGKLHFVNRQPGSGTRLWLDTVLSKAGIPSESIPGYQDDKMTHSAIARTIAEGNADVGIGLEAAARSYNLDFIPLTLDRYDLVIPADVVLLDPMQRLIEWLRLGSTRKMIEDLGGYVTDLTGRLEWSE